MSFLGHFYDILLDQALEIRQGILICACKFETMFVSLLMCSVSYAERIPPCV